MTDAQTKEFLRLFALPAAALALFWLAAALFLEQGTRFALGVEGGPIETVGLIAFALAAGLAFLRWRRERSTLALAATLAFALAALRELDVHKAFTSRSITSSRFYVSPETPLGEKLFGVLALLALLWIAWILARAAPAWLRRLRAGETRAWAIAFGLGLLGFGAVLDALGRTFPAIEPFRHAHYDLFVLIEESAELAGALVFVIAGHLALAREDGGDQSRSRK